MSLLPETYDDVAELTSDLCDLVDTPLVRQITGGIHVNDALIHDAWAALPSEWTTFWDSLPEPRLAQQHMIDSIDDNAAGIITHFGPHHRPPESLLGWFQTLRSVSLPRTQRTAESLVLPEKVALSMKTKKVNEVSDTAAYINRICQANGITRIIDMGSGQGYLSVTLAFLFPSLHVLAIDGSESQVAGSRELASSLGVPESRLQHLVRHIDGTGALAEEMSSWAQGQACMLVGLHACGNLSEHMLRYFTACSFIQHVAAVGCCYNHIVPRSDTSPDGFPMSARLRSRNLALSPTALMTGCQSPNNWERLDLTKPRSNFSRKQFYRAVLEKLFYDKGVRVIDVSTRPNWGIRTGDLASFERFSRRAIKCLGIDEKTVSTEDIVAYGERYKDQEPRIGILWTLSILCCKVVESIIALDRYWFLTEHQAEGVDIVQIFDYRISPRNMMLAASKKSSK